MYAPLGVMGPRSRELLSRLSDADLSSDAFPFATSQEIDLGYAQVRASRITYVGELGWELYIPTEYARTVYDALVAEGSAFGLTHAGYHAINSLRIEKGYRSWGHDLTTEDTPLEAGLKFAVAMKKPGGFIGRDALLVRKNEKLPRRMVSILLADEDAMIYHDEPIWWDSELVGRVTSAMYGHTLGACVGLGYISNEAGVDKSYIENGQFEVGVAGTRVAAKVSFRPFYDPDNRRIRL
jgi:4-methylaminobutanoate oxidase (formaldehyde-forming)